MLFLIVVRGLKVQKMDLPHWRNVPNAMTTWAVHDLESCMPGLDECVPQQSEKNGPGSTLCRHRDAREMMVVKGPRSGDSHSIACKYHLKVVEQREEGTLV